MRITFDYAKDLDHAYLQIGESRPVVESVELEGHADIRIDFDEDGQVAGIEFVAAGELLPLGRFGEAAERFGDD